MRSIVVFLLTLSACSGSRPARPHEPPDRTAARPAAATRPAVEGARGQSALRVEERAVETRRYRVFEPGSAHYALRLTRPARGDPAVLLAVAGTYTSPAGDVEGMVVLDGGVVRDKRLNWEGVLRIVDGRAEVERREAATFESEALARYRRERATLVQGHLLVHEGRARPLKPSPPLHRRAIASGARGAFVVDSVAPLELARFAADLVALGATSALNLDMGGWSEGFYRDDGGKLVTLGFDRSATAKQSNWLVIVRDEPR